MDTSLSYDKTFSTARRMVGLQSHISGVLPVSPLQEEVQTRSVRPNIQVRVVLPLRGGARKKTHRKRNRGDGSKSHANAAEAFSNWTGREGHFEYCLFVPFFVK